MIVDTPTRVPLELCKLVEETVNNAVVFGLDGGCIHTEAYSTLTIQRKFLYEWLEARVEPKEGEAMTAIRFR